MSRLTPPVSEADHRSGPDDAPVTLVEFGDCECPHCGAAYSIVEAVRRSMGARRLQLFAMAGDGLRWLMEECEMRKQPLKFQNPRIKEGSRSRDQGSKFRC